MKKPLFHCLGCSSPIRDGDDAMVVSIGEVDVKLEYAICPSCMGRALRDDAFETELNHRAENLRGRITA